MSNESELSASASTWGESPADVGQRRTAAVGAGGRDTEPPAADTTKINDQRRAKPPMTMDAWLARELAKRPVRSAEWRRNMLAWWGLRPAASDPVDIDQLGVKLPLASAGGLDENGTDIAT